MGFRGGRCYVAAVYDAMSLLEETKYLAKKYRLRPDTDRGQNFLISETVLDAIVAAASVTASETVLEIGTGLGTLTKALATQAAKVITVESDRRLESFLKQLSKQHSNIHLLLNDITKVKFSDISEELGPRYSVVANIPYYITGKIVEQLLTWEVVPQSIVLLVQLEVAKKYCAVAGDMSKQSLAAQFYSQPEIIEKVPAKSFWPVPAVDSAILRLNNVHSWDYEAPEKEVWQLIRIGFSSKRKKLVNNLASGLQITKTEAEKLLSATGVDVNVRAEDLSKEEWVTLTLKSKH